MSSRRSHLQRTAKDAVYASKLAAKENVRAKRKAGACFSSKAKLDDTVLVGGNNQQDSKASGEVFESPHNKRKCSKNPPTSANAIENNGAAPSNTGESEIQNNSYPSYFRLENYHFQEKFTVSSSLNEIPKEKQEDENTASYPKLSHHNGNFNVSCDEVYQFKNEIDTAFSKTDKSTTKLFTPLSESIVFINQYTESGRSQMTAVKPHSFEVLQKLQSTIASNMAEDILMRERKSTYHQQPLTPIFMTQRLTFEYGFHCDDSNDGGITGTQRSDTSSASQPDGKNYCDESNQFLDDSKSETPDVNEHKPCSNSLLLRVSTLQTPKSSLTSTKAISMQMSSFRATVSRDGYNPKKCSNDLNSTIFSANIGNGSNASSVSLINEGRNGSEEQPTLYSLNMDFRVPTKSEKPLSAEQDIKDKEMFQRNVGMTKDTNAGKFFSLQLASDASRRQRSYAATERDRGDFPGPPTLLTLDKGLAAQVTEHSSKFAQNCLNGTDSMDTRNSYRANHVQQLASDKLSTPKSQDVASGGLVELSDEEGRIVGLQISDVALSVSPQIRDTTFTHGSEVLGPKIGSSHDFSVSDDIFSSFPVFTTAGKRNVIEVSEKSLFAAGNFLSGLSSECHGNALQKDPFGNLRIRNKPIRDKSSRKTDTLMKEFSTSEVIANNHSSSCVAGNGYCCSDTPTFSTAGKGRTIKVSEHSLIEASNLLSGLSSKEAVTSGRSPKEMPTMVHSPWIQSSVTSASSAQHEGSKEKNYLLYTDFGVRCSHATNHDFAQADTLPSISGCGRLGLYLPKFSTAGKGTVIQVSERSFIDASKFLNNSASYDSARIGNALYTPRFQGACDSATAAVSGDRKKKTHSLLLGAMDSHNLIKSTTQSDDSRELVTRKQPCSFPAFSKAGMGHVLQVSEQRLIEAGKILNDAVPQTDESSSLRTPRFQSATVAVTEDCKKRAVLPSRDDAINCDLPLLADVPKIDTCTESTSDLACIYHPGASCAITDCSNLPEFSTAGTGQVIQVSDQSLIAARIFLMDSVSRRASGSSNIEKCLENASSNAFCTPRFQRSSATVAVTEDCRKHIDSLLREADPPIITDHSNLPKFFTAGMGHVIHVSEQSLAAAKNFLIDTSPRKEASISNIGKPLPHVSTIALCTPRSQRSGATVAVAEDCRRNTVSLLRDAAVSTDPHAIMYGLTIDTHKECIFDASSAACRHSPGALSSNGSSSSYASSSAVMGRVIQVRQDCLIEAGNFLNDTFPGRSADNSRIGKPLQTVIKKEQCYARFESGAVTSTEKRQSRADRKLSVVISDAPQIGTSMGQDSSSNLLSLPVFVTAGKKIAIEADSNSLMLADRFLNGAYQSESCDIVPNENHCDILSLSVPTQVLNDDVAITSGPSGRLVEDEDRLQELYQENPPPLGRKIASVTPGPCTFKDILGTFSGKPASPRSLSKAAGILGRSPTPISITSVPQVLDYKLQENSNERWWSKFLRDLPLRVSKLSLRDLDMIQGNSLFRSIDNLLKLGINRVLINVSSNNASFLVFSDDGTPSYFYQPSQKDQVEYWQIAFEGSSAKEMYLNLIQLGFSEDLITKRWVANHYRWVVWTSAAMERRFPQLLRGRFCTKKMVMDKLKKRCRKELFNGYRPALRKILNRDVAASSLMILCISNVFVNGVNNASIKLGIDNNVTPTHQQVDTSSVKVELTDGWYSILAMLDSNLSKLATIGQISVGSKLAFCGAILEGADDGIDPLDSGYNPQSPHCHVLLRLFSNSTRRAKWDAKLGFCNFPLAAIPTTAFSTIYPDGGPISLVELVLCKIYPMLYFEKDSKRILTESQESFENRKFERDYEIAMESIIEDRGRELTMITENDAPEIWNSKSDDPCFYSNSPSETGRQMKDLWTNQGRDLCAGFWKNLINDASVDVVIRKSTPFIRALVKILRRNQTEAGDYSSNLHSSAWLTIWEPSDDWISLLKEGTAVRLRNVKCKPSQIDGRIQLSANHNTSLELIPKLSDSILRFSGFEERLYSSMVSIHLLSKLQHFQHEFDVVGFKILTSSQTHPSLFRSAYVTDESGLLLRIDRYLDSENCCSPPWKVSKYAKERSSIYSFQNLRLIDFSIDQNCPVALWTESSVVKTRPSSRSFELFKFSETIEGSNYFRRVYESLSKTVAVIGKGDENLYAAIGIVLSVTKTSDDERQCNRSQDADIVIDCGSDALLRARISVKRLEAATGLLFEDDTILLSSNKLRNTGRYFSFTLKQYSHMQHGSSPEMNVVAMSKVDTSSLSCLYNL